MDAEIDARAGREHLAARLMLDELLPIAYLGLDADEADGGMRITKVFPDTGAAAAGLREGDVVLAVAGTRTEIGLALGRAIRRHRPGESVEVRYRRDGAESTVSAVLSKRPEEDEDEEEQFPEQRPGAAPPSPAALDFEGEPPGSLPALLESVLSGHGLPPRWIVVSDAGGARLRQDAADRTGIRFPMALVRDFAARDVAASVRFRFVGGAQDRAAGVVLRYRDPGNYLVARCNAVEGDLRIFRTANGVRRTLPGAIVRAEIGDEAWHTLTFRAEGPKLTATVDGKATATSYDTFLGAGRVGLWTKSDAVSDFDDLSFAPILQEEPK